MKLIQIINKDNTIEYTMILPKMTLETIINNLVKKYPLSKEAQFKLNYSPFGSERICFKLPSENIYSHISGYIRDNNRESNMLKIPINMIVKRNIVDYTSFYYNLESIIID